MISITVFNSRTPLINNFMLLITISLPGEEPAACSSSRSSFQAWSPCRSCSLVLHGDCAANRLCKAAVRSADPLVTTEFNVFNNKAPLVLSTFIK